MGLMRLPRFSFALLLGVALSAFAQVGGPISITNGPPGGVVGTPYQFQFLASGGSGKYAWSWVEADAPGGAIPPGLNL